MQTISRTSVKISMYEFPPNRYGEVLTQLPFELKIDMPPPDRGGRGYSDEYIAKSKDFTH